MECIRPIVLITGAIRTIGIGSSIAKELAKSGWDVAVTYWQPYDASMPWGSDPKEVQALCHKLEQFGVRSTAIAVDLSLPDSALHICFIAMVVSSDFWKARFFKLLSSCKTC